MDNITLRIDEEPPAEEEPPAAEEELAEEGLFEDDPSLERYMDGNSWRSRVVTDEHIMLLIGHVGVDSGQLMICDPCYADSEWQSEDECSLKLGDVLDYPLFQDREQNHYKYIGGRSDSDPIDTVYFENYESTIPRFEGYSGLAGERPTVNALHAAGIFTMVAKAEPAEGAPFSYAGACLASNRSGRNDADTPDPSSGEMVYRMGHAGAGVCSRTAFGDGTYPVYKVFDRRTSSFIKLEVIVA